MNANLSKTNYFDSFPDNREFYLLDSYENIKNFNTTNYEDPDYFCIIYENKEKQIEENAYKRKDFLIDYEFINVIQFNTSIEINFLISKNRFNIGGRENRLLTEIKSRQSLIKEIYKRTKFNFNIPVLFYFFIFLIIYPTKLIKIK